MIEVGDSSANGAGGLGDGNHRGATSARADGKSHSLKLTKYGVLSRKGAFLPPSASSPSVENLLSTEFGLRNTTEQRRQLRAAASRRTESGANGPSS